jgi:predicted dinucleotide-binding enzyme
MLVDLKICVMNIGIIGAGAMGSCLAAKLIGLGHSVSIANSRGPASLQQLAADTGAAAVTVEDAIKNKDLIIIAIPQKNIPDLPVHLFKQLPETVVVIDIGNYYPNLRDGVIPALEESGIDSLWVQQQLGVAVVKVFNAITAESLRELGQPKGERNRIALPLAGDDAKAKELVSGLVDDLGFDPFDIGHITDSWKQQPGSPIYCRDIPLDVLKKRLHTMTGAWSEMRAVVLIKRRSDEMLMKADYPAYLKTLT